MFHHRHLALSIVHAFMAVVLWVEATPLQAACALAAALVYGAAVYRSRSPGKGEPRSE